MIDTTNERFFTVACYRHIALMQEMLSFTGAIATVMLTSSSKAVCQHIMHVRQLSYCSVLRSSSVRSPDLWAPNSPDLNPANYHISGVMQDHVFQTAIQDMTDLRQCFIDTRVASRKTLWTTPLTNGVRDFRPE